MHQVVVGQLAVGAEPHELLGLAVGRRRIEPARHADGVRDQEAQRQGHERRLQVVMRGLVPQPQAINGAGYDIQGHEGRQKSRQWYAEGSGAGAEQSRP